MIEAKSTYINGKQVGHMYMHGKEVSKAYYLGDIFYQLEQAGFKRTALPSFCKGTGIISIGDNVILYGDNDSVNGTTKFHILHDGEYVRTEIREFSPNTTITTIPYYDEEMILVYVTNSGVTYMYSYGFSGFNSDIPHPSNYQIHGFFKDNMLILGNIAQYHPQISDGGQWWQIPEDMRENFEHFPNILQTVKFAGQQPIEAKQYVRYAIPLSTEIEYDVEYEFENPIIYDMVKDSATGRVYGLVATKFKKELFDYLLYLGNYEITSFEDGDISLGVCIKEPQWDIVTTYTGITNCEGRIINEYRKYGTYTIEKDNTSISVPGSGVMQHGYAISDFHSFANYVLRKTTNDNGYRNYEWVVLFDAVMTGFYNNKYWKFNPKDIFIRGSYEWDAGIFSSRNSLTWQYEEPVDFNRSDMGGGYSNVRCAWGSNGIYLDRFQNIFDEETMQVIQQHYIFHYSQ